MVQHEQYHDRSNITLKVNVTTADSEFQRWAPGVMPFINESKWSLHGKSATLGPFYPRKTRERYLFQIQVCLFFLQSLSWYCYLGTYGMSWSTGMDPRQHSIQPGEPLQNKGSTEHAHGICWDYHTPYHVEATSLRACWDNLLFGEVGGGGGWWTNSLLILISSILECGMAPLFRHCTIIWW